jgi:hypothetical protein
MVVVGTPLIAWSVLWAWGRSWGWGGFPDCASGTYFLADLGWLLEGLALGFVVGAIVAGLYAALVGGFLGLALMVLAVALLGPVGELGAIAGEQAAGCPVMNEGIGSLVAFFAVAGALVGYPVGWLVRRNRHRMLSQRGDRSARVRRQGASPSRRCRPM